MRTFSHRAVGTAPRHRLALAQGPVAHAAQREPPDVGRRVEVGDQRLERVVVVVLGCGDVVEQHLEERLQAVGAARPPVDEVGVVRVERRAPAASVAVHDREVDLVLVGVEVEEQLLHLVHDLGDAGVAAVDLVHHEDHRQAGLERLAQHEAGLRQRALAGVDEQEHAVDHGEAPLDLAAEVGVAGRVDDVDLHVAVPDRGVLGQDRDALLALEVHRVHDPVGDLLVGPERAGLAQHGVDEGGLAVVDVGDDGDVAQVAARASARGHSGPFGGETSIVPAASRPDARVGRFAELVGRRRGAVLVAVVVGVREVSVTADCAPTSEHPGQQRGDRPEDHRRDVPGQHDDDQRADELVLEPQVGAVVGEHHEHEDRDGADQCREGAGASARRVIHEDTTAPSVSPAPPPIAQSTGSATVLRPGPLTVDSSAAASTVRSRALTTAIAAPSHTARQSSLRIFFVRL